MASLKRARFVLLARLYLERLLARVHELMALEFRAINKALYQ